MVKRGTLLFPLVGVAACSSPLEIDVQLVDPCNQEAVTSVDFVRLEPRGEGLESEQLATIERVEAVETGPIELPLVSNFQLVATGHRGSFDAPPSALGVSAEVDLTEATGTLTLQVPFSLLGQFYRTTNLTAPADATDRCSALRQDRFGATATVLPGGQVLIVGGSRYTEGFLEFPRLVELYDPATGTFLDGPANSNRKWELLNGQARRFHTASLLPDGRVLIAGGQAPDAVNQGTEGALRSAFIIDPRDVSDIRIQEGGIAMMEARTGHQAAILSDGRVVLVGGRSLNPTDTRLEAQRYLASVEVYDPQSSAFLLATDAVGNAVGLSEARFGHSANAIPGSVDVLVAGGFNDRGPATGLEVLRFLPGGVERIPSATSLGIGPIFHGATLTQDGAVLVSGGYSTLNDVRGLAPTMSGRAVEMWAVDEATGAPQRVCQSNLTSARGQHTVSIVGRRALFVGGRDETGQPRRDGEVADLLSVSEAAASPSGCFARAPATQTMNDARAQHNAVVLPSTREILVLGGVQQDPIMSNEGLTTTSAEIFSDFARRALLSSPTGN